MGQLPNYFDMGFDKNLQRGDSLGSGSVMLPEGGLPISSSGGGGGGVSDSSSGGSAGGATSGSTELSGGSSNGTANLVEDQKQPSEMASGEIAEHTIIAADGHIRGGASDYLVGDGFWLGSYHGDPDDYRFFIGDSASNYLTYANGVLTIVGSITATSGTIGGFTIGSTNISATSGGNTTIISSGATAISIGPTGSPTFTVTQAGFLTATGASISGTISLAQTFTAGWDITQGEVAAIEADGKTYPPRYTANFVDLAASVTLTTAGTSATRGDACIVGHVETAATFKCTALGVVAYGGNVIYKASVVTNSPVAFATQTEGTVAAGSDGRVCSVLDTTALASYITGTTATGKVISGLNASISVNGATTISANALTPRIVRHSSTIVACAYIDTATGNLNARILTVGATTFTASAATTLVATVGATVTDFKRFGTTNYYMISYQDTSNNQSVVCVEFDGSTFTAGTPVVHVATTSGRFLEIDGLDSTRMIVLYLTDSNCIGTVFSRSTLTLSSGTPVTLKSDAPNPYNVNNRVDVVALGQDTFAFFYPTSSANVSNFALGRVTSTVPSNLGSVYAESQSNETVCNVLKYNPIYCGYFTQDSSGNQNTIFAAGAPTNTFPQTIGIVADTTATSATGGVVMQGYSDDVSGLTTATPYYVDVDGALITRAQGGLQRFGIALSATTMKVE